MGRPSPADFLHVSLNGLWPRKVYKYKMHSCYTLTLRLCWSGGSICAMREACLEFDPPWCTISFTILGCGLHISGQWSVPLVRFVMVGPTCHVWVGPTRQFWWVPQVMSGWVQLVMLNIGPACQVGDGPHVSCVWWVRPVIG